MARECKYAATNSWCSEVEHSTIKYMCIRNAEFGSEFALNLISQRSGLKKPDRRNLKLEIREMKIGEKKQWSDNIQHISDSRNSQ